MNGPRLVGRAAVVLAAAAVVVPTGPAGSARADVARADSVQIAVTNVLPSTPTPSRTANPLTVELTVTNLTDKAIDGVTIVGERGDPIGSQDALDASLADPTPPPSGGPPIPSTHPIKLDLPPGTPTAVPFTTTTSIADDGTGICLCHQAAIYPLFFSAHVTGAGGVDQLLGVGATYLPSFDESPAPPPPVYVSWVWPLLERPHRLLGSTVFTDDLLAQSVATDGRLSRALQVVEAVGGSVPLTLVIDPELLDELQVMATGTYTVESGGKTAKGTGQADAVSWLARLRGVLASDPGVDVELTPYADPDVQTLDGQGLDWSSSLPAAMIAPVTDALAGRSLDSSVAWPAAGALSTHTLATMAGAGVSTVVLGSDAVAPKPKKGAVAAGLARLRVGDRDVAAALTVPAVQKYAADAVTLGGAGAAAMPDLVAELAVRAAQEPDEEHAVTITAPRYVDPAVDAAVRAIKDTSTSTFARPIALRSAVSGSLLPTGRSHLTKVPRSAPRLDDRFLDAATHVAATLPAVGSLLDQKNDAAARALVAELPIALQRVESAAWRQAGAAATGAAFARQLTKKVDAITHGVHIVSPSSGAYTLASNSSPLPITVDNELPYPVTVRLEVRTVVNGLPGFSTKDIGEETVDSSQKRTLNVPTKTERSGRIRVEAILLTPNRIRLGEPVPLTVHSTALGFVGVVITIVAGAVLALALLVRVIRRVRNRRTGGTPRAAPLPQPQPVP